MKLICKSEPCENSNIKPDGENKRTLLKSSYMIHEKLYSHLKYSDKLMMYSINPKATTNINTRRKYIKHINTIHKMEL